jgi:hypothetical protein
MLYQSVLITFVLLRHSMQFGKWKLKCERMCLERDNRLSIGAPAAPSRGMQRVAQTTPATCPTADVPPRATHGVESSGGGGALHMHTHRSRTCQEAPLFSTSLCLVSCARLSTKWPEEPRTRTHMTRVAAA